MTPAVLFTRPDSPYLAMRLDCYDESRDARTYTGYGPVIAHPPCGLWGRLSQFSRAPDTEKDLARFAVDTVRAVGGVLEHPAYSSLWPTMGLPLPGQGRDAFDGWTLPILQSWFGHRAPKPTWLYVVGCPPTRVPDMLLHLGIPEGRIENMGRAERERTPEPLARWLVELASRCTRGRSA